MGHPPLVDEVDHLKVEFSDKFITKLETLLDLTTIQNFLCCFTQKLETPSEFYFCIAVFFWIGFFAFI